MHGLAPDRCLAGSPPCWGCPGPRQTDPETRCPGAECRRKPAYGGPPFGKQGGSGVHTKQTADQHCHFQLPTRRSRSQGLRVDLRPRSEPAGAWRSTAARARGSATHRRAAARGLPDRKQCRRKMASHRATYTFASIMMQDRGRSVFKIRDTRSGSFGRKHRDDLRRTNPNASGMRNRRAGRGHTASSTKRRGAIPVAAWIALSHLQPPTDTRLGALRDF